MADLDKRLDRLISDQESMRKVLETAKTILDQQDSAASGSAPTPMPQIDGTSLSELLANALGQTASPSAPSEQSASDTGGQQPQSMSALASILPQLMLAMSGQENFVKQERVTLLRAMRPYMSDNRWSSIDRALRMANMTKAATAALHTLGR